MAGKYSTGKNAIAISDRSGLQFPYIEMVREWTGAWVHISEFESKQPQLEIKVRGGDAQALEHPRPPERTAPAVTILLPPNPFQTYAAASSIIFVNSPSHGRDTATTVRFRGTIEVAPGTGTVDDPVAGYATPKDFDGISGTNIIKAAGYTITVGRYTNVTTTLASAITDTTTNSGITLTDGSSFLTTNDNEPQVALIGSELIRYSTISSNVLGQVSPQATSMNPQWVQRGAYGSTAATHSAGATVRNLTNPTDWYYFTVDTNTATVGSIRGGGNSVSAGPVTITP